MFGSGRTLDVGINLCMSARKNDVTRFEVAEVQSPSGCPMPKLPAVHGSQCGVRVPKTPGFWKLVSGPGVLGPWHSWTLAPWLGRRPFWHVVVQLSGPLHNKDNYL